MKQINTLIIEDEEGAINTLIGMLTEFCPTIHITGCAKTVTEALVCIEESKPQLVFLDVQLPPYGTGFDVLNLTKYQDFGVVFTTAYAEFAVKAINTIQPWGYLLKPFSLSDLMNTVKSVESKLCTEKTKFDFLAESTKSVIILNLRKDKLVVKINEILYIEADGSVTYVFLYKNNKVEKIAVPKTLRQVEAILPVEIFCRIHHGYTVNLMHVKRIEKTGRNGRIHLPEAVTLPVSIKKMDVFEQEFQLFLENAKASAPK